MLNFIKCKKEKVKIINETYNLNYETKLIKNLEKDLKKYNNNLKICKNIFNKYKTKKNQIPKNVIKNCRYTPEEFDIFLKIFNDLSINEFYNFILFLNNYNVFEEQIDNYKNIIHFIEALIKDKKKLIDLINQANKSNFFNIKKIVNEINKIELLIPYHNLNISCTQDLIDKNEKTIKYVCNKIKKEKN